MEFVCKPDQIESHLDSDHKTEILVNGDWQEIESVDDSLWDWTFERGHNFNRIVFLENGESVFVFWDENVTLRKVRKDASDEQQ